MGAGMTVSALDCIAVPQRNFKSSLWLTNTSMRPLDLCCTAL